MKANKLMIGDWVDFGSFIRQVAQYDYCQDVNGDCVLDGVKPIPLTPEILEKNGFERTELCFYCYLNDDENCRIMYYPKDRNYTRGSYNYADINRGCIDINELPLEFVHELQHALRLCGMTDLADNFKV